MRSRILYIFFLLIIPFIFACQGDADQNNSNGVTSIPVDNEDPEVMIQSLTTQIGKSPDDYSLFKDRALAYYEIDSIKNAIADMDYAIELFRNGHELHYWRGFFAFAENDTVKAREEFQAAIGLGSKNPEAYYQMGQIFFFQGNEERALEFYKRAAELDETSPIYVFAQGFLEEKRKNHSKALAAYRQALAIDSTFDKALIQLHDLYFNEYNSEAEAMKYVEKLIAVRPSHPLGRFYKGNYHLRRALTFTGESQQAAFKEQINHAVVEYTVSINRDPNFAQANYNRGYCYFLGDRHDEAIQDFEKCLEINPKHPQAAFMLGSLYEYFKDLKTALSYYEMSLESDPSNADTQTAVKELKAALQ